MRPVVDSKFKNIASRRAEDKKNYFWLIFWPIVVVAFFILIFYLQNKYLFINQVEVGHSLINNRFHLTQTKDVQNQLQSFLNQKWLFFFKKNTPLTFSTGRAIDLIKSDGRINEINISWRPPHKIKAVIEEKIPVAILSVSGDKDYYLDKDGEIIYLATSPLVDLTTNQPFDFPIIYDQTEANSGFKPYLDALKTALQAFNALNGVNYPLVMKTVKITQNSGFFLGEGQAGPGFKIYLLLDPGEMANEIARLKILLNQKLQNTVPQYIDLRFGEKVYYK